MTDKKPSLKPDVVLNDYWKDNEKFADLLNAVLFELLKILYDSKLTYKQRMEKAKTYKVSNTVAVAVATATNSRLETAEIGDDDMCGVFEYVREEGLKEGIERGIE